MDIPMIILVGVVCLFVGVVMGFVIARLFRQRSKEAPTPASGRGGLVEVARFWIDEDRNRYYPEIDGKLIRAGTDLDPGQRRSLLRLIEYLRGFGQSSGAQSRVGDKFVKERSGAGLEAEASTFDSVPQDAKQRVSFLGSVSKVLQPEGLKKVIAEKSIAAQIDEVLQEMLEGDPLESKGIRIMEMPGKEMVVMVGLNQYPGVNEVPDADVRAIIKEAVQEWERRIASDEAHVNELDRS